MKICTMNFFICAMLFFTQSVIACQGQVVIHRQDPEKQCLTSDLTWLQKKAPSVIKDLITGYVGDLADEQFGTESIINGDYLDPISAIALGSRLIAIAQHRRLKMVCVLPQARFFQTQEKLEPHELGNATYYARELSKVSVLAFSPNDTTLAVGFESGVLLCLDTASLGEKYTLRPAVAIGSVTALAFDPHNATILAAGYQNNCVIKWNTRLRIGDQSYNVSDVPKKLGSVDKFSATI